MGKKLAALLFAGSILFNGINISAQNLNDLPTEKDRYKYISPGDSPTGKIIRDFDGAGNSVTIYWYDWNNDGVLQDNELFVDINGDGILDMYLSYFLKWYEKEAEKRVEWKRSIC